MQHIIHIILFYFSSVMYELDRNNLFTIQQQISTQGCVSVCSFTRASERYIVIGNQQNNIGKYNHI